MSGTLPLPDELARTIAACVDRLGADVTATIAQNPRSTITPGQQTPEPRERRAIELLGELGLQAASRGGLELEGTLGEGGMGIVRLATQRSVGRKVAVKTLRAEVRSDATLTKLLHEGWVTGALEHPNVVPVYDIAIAEGESPLIVLKRIEGMHWGTLIANPQRIRDEFDVTDPLEWNLRTLMQVCNAVHFAHSRKILHRDLKPENVMLGEFGEVYVVDWGIAVSLEDDGSGRLPLLARAPRLAGTPCYMAPEMLVDDLGPLSERTDVYLLGAVLYEVLSGTPPHTGKDITAIFASVLRSEPPLPDDSPAELVRICRRAMARDPQSRFESAADLRLALQDYLQHAGSMRIVEEAEQSLERLLRLVDTDDRSDAHRSAVYNLLGECRFGFRSATASWSENVSALEGLDRALTAGIELELRRKDARAAALLLEEMTAPSHELRERVGAARDTQLREERKNEQLRRVGAELDPEVGKRSRLLVGVGLGVLWSVAPVFGHFATDGSRSMTARYALTFDVVLFALVVGAAIATRRGLEGSALNRRIVGTLAFAVAGKGALDIWVTLAGRHPRDGLVLSTLLFFAVASVTAIHVSWRLALCAGGYFAAFVFASMKPDLMLLGVAAANVLLTLTLIWVWVPRREAAR